MNIFTKITSIGCLISGLLFAGCTTLGPAQISAAAIVVKQAAYVGATYAIQKDATSAKYFELATVALDKFALGEDLSPTAFQDALAKVLPQVQNQWVQLGIDTVVVAYDAAYGQYVVGQVNSNATAKVFIVAVDDGFKKALTPPATTLKATRVEKPDLVKIRKDVLATRKAR